MRHTRRWNAESRRYREAGDIVAKKLRWQILCVCSMLVAAALHGFPLLIFRHPVRRRIPIFNIALIRVRSVHIFHLIYSYRVFLLFGVWYSLHFAVVVVFALIYERIAASHSSFYFGDARYWPIAIGTARRRKWGMDSRASSGGDGSGRIAEIKTDEPRYWISGRVEKKCLSEETIHSYRIVECVISKIFRFLNPVKHQVLIQIEWKNRKGHQKKTQILQFYFAADARADDLWHQIEKLHNNAGRWFFKIITLINAECAV